MSEYSTISINEIIFKSLEGEISDEENRILNDFVSRPGNAAYYCQSLRLHVALKNRANLLTENSLQQAGCPGLEELAFYEKIASAAELPKEKPQPELVPTAVCPRTAGRKISTFQIATFAMSAAAILFIVLFLKLAPVKQYSTEVATLADQINVTWMDSRISFKNGDRLWTNRMPVGIDRGILKIKYDDGVDVLIEGPAKFAVERTGIYLDYGRLFSRVSDSGLGFSVETPMSRFVDMGTEFGVQADVNGSTELHVLKGKVQLFAGSGGNAKFSQMLTENEAARYDANTGKTQTVPIRTEVFVQSINSTSQLIWRGQKSLDLADIVGGGDGTGNGGRNKAILWDGQQSAGSGGLPLISPAPNAYVPVHFSPFIDGIFVPSSEREPVRLSSTAEELNLDEFLKQDTNGLITLMVFQKGSDAAPTYWFCTKEGAAGDRTRMPSLYFPKGSNGQPALVTTADNRGADTCIINDIRTQSARRYGASSIIPCRYIKDERLRIIYLRFDISELEDLSESTLNLCLQSGNRNRSLSVYGLKDGPADYWDEATLNYSTSPGLKPAALGNYEVDDSQCVPLGTFRAVDNRGSVKPISVNSDGSLKWTSPEPGDGTAYAITNADSFCDSLSTNRPVALRLGNALCGTRDNPSILMHANAGITFDLEKLRTKFGSLKSFTAFCGLSASALSETGTDSPMASFYVLLDGQDVFSTEDLTPEDEPGVIDVKLTNQHRYLTLITTQGTDDSSDNDLCLFVKPRINLE